MSATGERLEEVAPGTHGQSCEGARAGLEHEGAVEQDAYGLRPLGGEDADGNARRLACEGEDLKVRW